MAHYDAKKDIEFLRSHGVTSERDQISWLRDNRGVKLNSRSLSELAGGARTYDSVAQASGGDRQRGQGPSQQQQSEEDGKKSYVTDNLRQDVDKSGAIRQSSTMTLVGNVGAGKGHINISRYQNGDGAAFIYDEVTGNLYKTNTWSDVSRNEKGWVDGRGRRFKGWVHPESETSWSLKSEGEIKYEARKKGGYGMYAAFGDEKTPAAGTDAFNKWALEEYKNSRGQEALSHRYDPSKGKLNVGTDYGQLGTITVRDWVALGMPSSFGGLTISESDLEPFRGKSADQVLAMTGGGQGLLVGQDRKKRHSGFAKVVGGTLGSHAADKFAKAANVGAAVLGMLPTPVTKAIAYGLRYAATEDQSGGSQRLATRHVAQTMTTDAVNSAIVAAAAAATYFSAGLLAPYTGALVASVVAGAATGAAAGAATSVADAGVARVYTGQHDTHHIRTEAGKSAVSGGIAGAVTGATGAMLNGPVNPASSAYGNAPWYGRLSGLTRVGINATTQGVLAYQRGGPDKGLSAALAAGNAVVGDVRSSWNTPRMPSNYVEAAALQSRVDAGGWGALGPEAYLGSSNNQVGSAPTPNEWMRWPDVAKIGANGPIPKEGLYAQISNGRAVGTNMTIGDVLFHRNMGFGGGVAALTAAGGGAATPGLKAEIDARLDKATWWNTYRANQGNVSYSDVFNGVRLSADTWYAKLDAGKFLGLLPGAASPTRHIWSGDPSTGVAGLGPRVMNTLDSLTFGIFGLTGTKPSVSAEAGSLGGRGLLGGTTVEVGGRKMTAEELVSRIDRPSPSLSKMFEQGASTAGDLTVNPWWWKSRLFWARRAIPGASSAPATSAEVPVARKSVRRGGR